MTDNPPRSAFGLPCVYSTLPTSATLLSTFRDESLTTSLCLLLVGHFEKFYPHGLSIHVGDTLHTAEVDPKPSVGRLPNESRYLPGVPDGVAAPSQMSIMTALP